MRAVALGPGRAAFATETERGHETQFQYCRVLLSVRCLPDRSSGGEDQEAEACRRPQSQRRRRRACAPTSSACARSRRPKCRPRVRSGVRRAGWYGWEPMPRRFACTMWSRLWSPRAWPHRPTARSRTPAPRTPTPGLTALFGKLKAANALQNLVGMTAGLRPDGAGAEHHQLKPRDHLWRRGGGRAAQRNAGGAGYAAVDLFAADAADQAARAGAPRGCELRRTRCSRQP